MKIMHSDLTKNVTDATKQNVSHISKDEMSSTKNMLAHGIYLGLYAPFKYLSFPFFNLFRYLVLKCFCKQILSSYISDGVTIMFPWRVSIAERCSLNQGVIIDGTGGVTIGRGTRIAPYVCINTADHNFECPNTMIADQGFIAAPVIIEEDVWIGASAIINKGVIIGKGSVIGSGAVVTKSVPPFSIAVGVPCRVIASRAG